MSYIKKIGYFKITILLVLALTITLVEFFVIFSKQITVVDFELTQDQTCQAIGGNWLSEFKECEYASLEWCNERGGIFQECESACRHDKDAQICTLQCVPVCLLDTKEQLFSNSPEEVIFSIDGHLFKLYDNNYSEQDETGIKTKIWGRRIAGDLNSDGFDDLVMIITTTQETDGGELSYYVIASLFEPLMNKYLGTNAIFLGDKIAPQNINIEDGLIIANYISSEENKNITSKPLISVTQKMKIENENNLVVFQKTYGYKDMIYLDSPLPGEKIKSPLTVRGAARGNWFFEADFPVVLADWDGLIIAEGIAQAQDDWMTEDYVNFEVELNFKTPNLYDRGSLILKKDNPSGLAVNDDAFEISVTFDKNEDLAE